MAPTRDRISNLPDELIHHILSFLPSSQIALTSLLSKRWNRLWLTMPKADVISALPVELLCRILSLLPAKQIFATSCLSRCWRRLYQRICDINLNDTEDDHRDKDAYFDYTDIASVLICSCDQSLKTLTLLSASPFANTNSLRAWLGEAIYRKVEHVNLTFLQHSPTAPILLYEKILMCSTLVDLNLNGNGVLTIDYLDNSTNLPNLKKLHFTRVHFLKLQFLIKILSVCPLLEDLLIKNVTADDHNAAATADMLKPFPNLLKAHISDSSSSISSCFPLNLFYNVNFLRTQVTLQHQDTTQFLNLTHMELTIVDDEYSSSSSSCDWLNKFVSACFSLHTLVIHYKVC
jgi:hypothetical protein